MALPGGVALQFAPSFPELLDTLWNFAVAWTIKYWWALVILFILWYMRQYRTVRQMFGGDPPLGASFVALQRTLEHIGDVLTETSIRLFVTITLAIGGLVWLLQGVGTFWFGFTGFEPVVLGNIAAILTAAAAGLGVDWIRPWMVLAAFVVVAGVAVFFRMANQRAEELDN